MIKKLRSIIAVSAFGVAALSVMAEEIKEVVILGNSICKHGPAPKIGWNHDWGMAATSEDKDYAHILYKKICDKLAGSQKTAPELKLAGNAVNRVDLSRWDTKATANADIIIIQLSDNFRKPVTVEDFQKPYEAMVKDFIGKRNPIVICVSNWGGGPKAVLIEAAAKNLGVKFVNIARLSADPVNKALSEGHFSHGGVNWHPGDRGMAAIAEAIWAELEPEMDKKLKGK